MIGFIVIVSLLLIFGALLIRSANNLSYDFAQYRHRNRYPDSPLGYMESKEFRKAMRKARR